jgi:hypothetical protein
MLAWLVQLDIDDIQGVGRALLRAGVREPGDLANLFSHDLRGLQLDRNDESRLLKNLAELRRPADEEADRGRRRRRVGEGAAVRAPAD